MQEPGAAPGAAGEPREKPGMTRMRCPHAHVQGVEHHAAGYWLPCVHAQGYCDMNMAALTYARRPPFLVRMGRVLTLLE